MRYLVTSSLFLVACSSASATQPPAPAPRNLVCERVKLLNAKAECVPEFSGATELQTHTARVTVQGEKAPVTIVCGLNAGQLAMRCDGLEWQAPKQEAKADEKAAPAKAAKK